MFDDFKELLSIFNAHNVKYLVVGGYAVSFHAQPRATKDIDLLIKPDAGNATAVYAALAKFGAPLEGPKWKTSSNATSFSDWGTHQSWWIFCRKSAASTLTKHGNGESRL